MLSIIVSNFDSMRFARCSAFNARSSAFSALFSAFSALASAFSARSSNVLFCLLICFSNVSMLAFVDGGLVSAPIFFLLLLLLLLDLLKRFLLLLLFVEELLDDAATLFRENIIVPYYEGGDCKKVQCIFSAISALYRLLKVFDNNTDSGTIDNGAIRVTGIKTGILKDNV